jgi:hypothetical protein
MEKLFKKLVGKKISSIRYMTKDECEALGFHKSSVIIRLDDGTWLIPIADDEMNDGGSLYTISKGEENIIPTTYTK